MSDPLTEIEERKAQQDLGTTAYRVFVGARVEGASRFEAALVVYAWFRAAMGHSAESSE